MSHQVYTLVFHKTNFAKEGSLLQIFCSFSNKEIHTAVLSSSKSFFPHLCSNDFKKTKGGGGQVLGKRLQRLVTVLLFFQIHKIIFSGSLSLLPLLLLHPAAATAEKPSNNTSCKPCLVLRAVISWPGSTIKTYQSVIPN